MPYLNKIIYLCPICCDSVVEFEEAAVGRFTYHTERLCTSCALLIAQRDKFLAAKPHLTPYQAEIDRLLDASPDRLATITALLQVKLADLNANLAKLKEIL